MPESGAPAWPSVKVHPGVDDTRIRLVGRGRAMGTDCALHIVASDANHGFDAVGQLWSLLHTCDHLWSRFRDDSELTALNNASVTNVEVSELTALLVSAMVWAFGATDGIVDASVLPALVEAGYDQDFDRVVARDQRSTDVDAAGPGAHSERFDAAPSGSGSRSSVPGLTQVTTEPQRVVRPAGLRLDSGGVGKGLAADLLAGTARDAGVLGVLVDLGGDLRAIGCDEHDVPWRVGVADPLAPGRLPDEWMVTDAGVATSTTAKRRWGIDAHHLIDPRTAKPARTDLLQVTAVAATALEAETWAKTALILGSDQALPWLRDRAIEAVLITRDGRIDHTPGGTS